MRGLVVERVRRIVARFVPQFQLPGFFAGHRIGSDTVAELAWMVGLLHGLGVRDYEGIASEEALRRLLRRVDGKATQAFFSFRVAEALLAFGGWENNPVLAGMTAAERHNLAEATDSTSMYDRGSGQLHRAANYWAVLARCEHRRVQLGLVDRDASLLPLALERVGELLCRSQTGFIDDHAGNEGTYDIYSPDTVLFLEPLWEQLDPRLLRQAQQASSDLVHASAMENGACICWGRSLGAHSVALTAEWCSAALRLGMSDDPSRSLGLARWAFERLRDEWFADDLISAHRGRQTFGYRGPHRLLQMTLDVLSKLLFAADQLELAGDQDIEAVTSERALFPLQDRLIHFETGRPLGVWLYRDERLAFQLPVVFGTRADYQCFPRAPGLLANPVDSALSVGGPRVWLAGGSHATCGPACLLEKRPGALRAAFDRFVPLDRSDSASPRARRDVTFRVHRGAIEAEETWTFEEVVPEAISLDFAETGKRPLWVTVESSSGCRRSVVATRDMPGYRSYFDEIVRWHQADIEPARQVRVRWSVRPALRVAHVPHDHDYNRALYDEVCADGSIVERGFVQGLCGQRMGMLRELVRDADILHVGWPEHLFEAHGLPDEKFDAMLREQLDWLRSSGRRIVWTQHNRLPHHWPVERGQVLYRMWAEAVDGVIHHSRWGMELMRRELPYRSTCRHVVIPHGHFGAQMPRRASRAELEAKHGVPPAAIRVGLLGRSQATKQSDLIVRAFLEGTRQRDDLQLLVTARPQDESLLGGRNVVALAREPRVSRQTIAEQTQLCDALVIAHTGPTYLTSGMPADAIGLGLAVIVNDWGYFREHLGDAAIYHDNTEAGLARVFQSLTAEQVVEAGRRSAALQRQYGWPALAEQTRAFLWSIAEG